MIDVKTHVHYYPDKQVKVTPLNAEKSALAKELTQNNNNNVQQYTTGGYYNGTYYEAVPVQGTMNNMEVSLPKDGTGQDLNRKEKEKIRVAEKLNEDQLLLCSSLIAGFALNEKQWGMRTSKVLYCIWWIC